MAKVKRNTPDPAKSVPQETTGLFDLIAAMNDQMAKLEVSLLELGDQLVPVIDPQRKAVFETSDRGITPLIEASPAGKDMAHWHWLLQVMLHRVDGLKQSLDLQGFSSELELITTRKKNG